MPILIYFVFYKGSMIERVCFSMSNQRLVDKMLDWDNVDVLLITGSKL